MITGAHAALLLYHCAITAIRSVPHSPSPCAETAAHSSVTRVAESHNADLTKKRPCRAAPHEAAAGADGAGYQRAQVALRTP